ESIQLDPARGTVALDGDAAFQLVDAEIHAARIERDQGAIESGGPDEALQISERAARSIEQPAVRTLRAREDGLRDQLKKVRLAIGQACPHCGPRRRDGHRTPCDAAEPCQQPEAGSRLPERSGQALAHSRSRIPKEGLMSIRRGRYHRTTLDR